MQRCSLMHFTSQYIAFLLNRGQIYSTDYKRSIRTYEKSMCKQKHVKPISIATLVIHSIDLVTQCLAHINHEQAWDGKNAAVGRALLVIANVVSVALFILLLIYVLCRAKRPPKVKERLILFIALGFIFTIFYLLVFTAFFLGLCHDKVPFPLVMIIISWFIVNVALILIIIMILITQEQNPQIDVNNSKKTDEPKSYIKSTSANYC